MKENETTLYKQGAYGILEYHIWSEGNVIHILANGQQYQEVVESGKAGRSLAEQIRLRINARVRSKLDQGFKRTKDELDDFDTNSLGLLLPMKAKPLKDVKNFTLLNNYVQAKYDGHRCLIARSSREMIPYSRNGKLITTIDHITDTLRSKLPYDVILDGELYCHGESLQTIASWAKRKQPNTEKLQYIVYDIIVPGSMDLTFAERLEILEELKTKGMFNQSVRLATTILHNETKENAKFDIDKYHNLACQYGYEGSILRTANGLYQPNKRPADLIKVKKRYDSEFRIVDVIPGTDDIGILVLKNQDGNMFKTIAPGTMAMKRKAFMEKESFIGKLVTCEYAGLTDDGIPFHCVAKRYREDV